MEVTHLLDLVDDENVAYQVWERPDGKFGYRVHDLDADQNVGGCCYFYATREQAEARARDDHARSQRLLANS